MSDSAEDLLVGREDLERVLRVMLDEYRADPILFVLKMIDVSVADEREACARVAEGINSNSDSIVRPVGIKIARMIRTRSMEGH